MPVPKEANAADEPLDAVDIELAAAAGEAHEDKPAAPAKEEPKPGAGVTHSSSDMDDSEAVDINDMLASIDKKVDAGEPAGPSKAGADKDIADLDEIIKLEETTKLERPDQKKGRK